MNEILSQHADLRDALTIGEQCRLSQNAQQFLHADLSPDDYFEALLANQLYPDAIRFLAQTLPKQHAVWWGCLCVWHATRGSLPPVAAAALEAALEWVLDPYEANRQGAGEAAEADGFDTPAGCLAMAAFWSGGSMSRPELPGVPPPPDLTGRVVGGAILLSAVRGGLLQVYDRFRQCLALGLEVARGENLWPAESIHETNGRSEPEVFAVPPPKVVAPSRNGHLSSLAYRCRVLRAAEICAHTESINVNEATATVF